MTVQLYCGDCLEILPTLEAESVDAVITDPPYGIDYQSAWRIDRAQRKPKIANDKQPFIWWLRDAYRMTSSGGSLLCFCEWRHENVFRMAIEVAGYTIRSQVIWDREWHGLGDLSRQFAPQHDIIWFATKENFSFRNGRPKSIVRSKRLAADKLVHPNEKPVDLMVQLVSAVAGVGQTVLDPFMGSGTTGVACVQTGRHFIGCEKDAGYFEIAQRRIAEAQAQPSLLELAT